MEETEKESSPPKPSPKRKKLLWGMSTLFLFIGICAVLFWLIWGRFYEYTDDAYVSGNLVFVTPQVSGIVTSIYIDNSQRVNQGHLLIELDKTMFQIALEESKANLANEIRNVAQLFLQTKQALAMIEVAKAQLKTAAQDFERRTFLINSGGVSAENFDHSQNELSAAFFTLAAAEATHASLLVQIDKTTVEKHPRVKKAEEQLKTHRRAHRTSWTKSTGWRAPILHRPSRPNMG